MAPTVAVMAAGAMGSTVAARLSAHGCTVLTNLNGRSQSSFNRAKTAGMQIVTLKEIVNQAEWLLSIVPPDQAETFARKIFTACKGECETSQSRIKFVDCNATSPATVKRISALATEHGVPFIDSCIIGGPPREGYDPTFYASSNDKILLQEFGVFRQFGLNVELLQGEGVSIGNASALKMSYAGITKGTTGLATTMILGQTIPRFLKLQVHLLISLTAAHASSPATAKALLKAMSQSQIPLLKRLSWSIPDAFPKAYRFEGEMREISDFVKEHVGTGEAKIHEGLASVYNRLASVASEPDNDEFEALKSFVEGGKRATS